MADTNYTVLCSTSMINSGVGSATIMYGDKTTTGMRVYLRWEGAGTTGERCWQVSGMAV